MDGVAQINGASAIDTALAAIGRDLGALAHDAQTVAQTVLPADQAGNAVNALVDSLQQRLAISATAQVLGGYDRAVGSLVDVMA